MVRSPLAVLFAAAVLGVLAPAALPPASALDAGPVLFVVPVPLAPVHLDGEFPVTLDSTAGTLEGTLSVSLAADGGLAGTLDLGGDSFAVTGSQAFKNGKGSISLVGTGAAGTLSWKGKFSGGGFAGKAKGTGASIPAKGTFAIDAGDAPPLLAYLDLPLAAAGSGALTGTGSATIDASAVGLTVAGTAAKGISLKATGSGFLWSAKGKPALIGGWTVNWKAAARGCRASGKGIPLVPVAVDVLEGAVPFPGPYPALAEVGLPASMGGGTEEGFPGQVLAFFEPEVAEADAVAAIGVAGGSVLGMTPAAGLYLVSVAGGGEAAAVNALSGATGVRYALPHLAAYRMGTSVTIIDDCEGAHGIGVVGSFVQEGGKGAVCFSDANGSGGVIPQVTLESLFKAVRDNGDLPSLVNISTAGKTDRTWLGVMRAFLAAISAIPEGSRENLVVAISAGNDNLSLGPLLAELRLDPRLAAVLDRNVVIVGASAATFAPSNDAPMDPDVVLGTNVLTPDGLQQGTSFAAPRVLAILQKLMDLRKAGARLALLALKRAAAGNPNHEVVESEVLAALDDLLSRPVLAVKPGSLVFRADEGADDPPAQSIVVLNLGRKGKDLQYRVEGAPSWLQVTDPGKPVDGGGRATVSIRPQSSTMFAGTYQTVVTIIDELAYPISVAVPVTLIIKPPDVYSGAFATSMGSHTTYAGCTFGLSLSGTLNLRPREGAAGAVLGDGDTDGNLGIVVTYTPAYTTCTASPFTEHGTGTISGTKSNLSIQLTSGASFTMDFTGAWSGNTITGSATWDQRYSADGEYVYKTGTIPSLTLTLQP